MWRDGFPVDDLDVASSLFHHMHGFCDELRSLWLVGDHGGVWVFCTRERSLGGLSRPSDRLKLASRSVPHEQGRDQTAHRNPRFPAMLDGLRGVWARS
jgi:hypothetical protein